MQVTPSEEIKDTDEGGRGCGGCCIVPYMQNSSRCSTIENRDRDACVF